MRSNENIAALLLVFFTGAVFQQVGCCSDGWLPFHNLCVKIYTRLTPNYGARFVCLMEGAVIVPVSVVDMRNFLTIHTSAYSQMKFWVQAASSEYNISEPALEQCFTFMNGTTERSDCNVQGGIICARHHPLYDPTENCLEGSSEHSFIGEETGNCVYRTPAASTYEDVHTKCAENQGRFLDLDEIMRDGLTAFNEHKVMMNDGLKYWTDLKMNGTSVMWKNGELLENGTIFVPGRGECITVSFNFTNIVSAIVYQTDCGDHAYAICAAPFISSPILPPMPTQPFITTQQPDAPTYCPPGHNWKVYNGDCFWETSFETSRMSWYDARSHCQAYGGDLSSFHSIDEEKIGLSFQYGTHPHPYWIGLRLDLETETYKWSDGSPLDYQNWAPGHPNHKDKRLQCVSMDAQSVHWLSTLCGMISWFICRVPKRVNPPIPVVPTPTPLATCEESDSSPQQFFFQGFCYNFVSITHNWYRAEEYCENLGSKLVSIHSDDEIGFLLRMLYDSKNIVGNRVWIGLNTLRNGVLRWTDHSPVDFTYWNENEPNNVRNLERCCSMYVRNGLWNDDICNEPMGFVCKRPKNTTDVYVIPTTPDPRLGNCKKGWYEHHDRCYLPVGYGGKERLNWTEASTFCESQKGYLVSIRDSKEQAFLSYLIQGLQEDTWIGLHDTIQSGRYYWLDNSDIQYTNWALGEPSFFGIQEDCVKMVYDSPDSGEWQDEVCKKKLPFICYTEKDPILPKPNYNRGLNCIYPPDYLKLGNMCFKMYSNISATWEEAEAGCRKEGANLISISNAQVQAVATYLGMEVNQTFWIGLEYKEASQQFEWLNGHPFSITKWGKNEPSPAETPCYASSSDGAWASFPCQEQLSYICQIAPGKVPARKAYTGNCPNTNVDWKPTKGSYCHLYSNSIASWFFAHMICFRQGSYLISFHSLEELEMVRKHIKPEMRSIFIGLMRNLNGGFTWSNSRPVDFVNWDEGEPANERYNCVEMRADTLKWRVAKCDVAKPFICTAEKDQLIYSIPGKDKLISDSNSGLSTAALIAIPVGLIIGLSALLFFLRSTLRKCSYPGAALRNPFRQRSVSYENALYNVDASSMEFQSDSL